MQNHKKVQIMECIIVFMMIAMHIFLCCTTIVGFLMQEFKQNISLKQIREFVTDVYHCADENLIFKNEFVYAGNWLEAHIGWDADCDGLGIDFSYICLPNKLNKYIVTDFDGKYQMANQNADRLLSGLKDKGVEFLDVRENIPWGYKAS